MDANGDTTYKSDLCQPHRASYASFHAHRQHTLHARPLLAGTDVAIGGLQTKVKSSRLMKGNQTLMFSQDPYRVHITGLPTDSPDSPVTTIAIECESEPTQDNILVRKNKPRASV
jgi:alpha-L-fucosidase